MGRGLLNYTTTIAAEKTVGEIQRRLAAAGARAILVEYDAARRPSAIAFRIATAAGERPYLLPARIGAVERTLAAQARAGKIPRRFATAEQAARVGWRVLKNWIEAQLAIIETGMVAFEEAMLPYLQVSGQATVYEALRDRGFTLELPGPSDR
jgi:hypothetical protein